MVSIPMVCVGTSFGHARLLPESPPGSARPCQPRPGGPRSPVCGPGGCGLEAEDGGRSRSGGQDAACPDPGRAPMWPEGLLPASPALGAVPGESPVWEPESVGRGRLSLEPPRSQRELMTAWGSLPDSQAGLGLPRPSPHGESPLSLPPSLTPRMFGVSPLAPLPDPPPTGPMARGPEGSAKLGNSDLPLIKLRDLGRGPPGTQIPQE